MNLFFKAITVNVVLMLLVGCSSVQSRGERDWVGYSETGKASFYADKHESMKTASGEIYKHSLNTAAHKNLPFGTKVKVTNLENDKSIIVKVNDRGPFVKGRIIDLSKSSFKSIGSTSSGILNVKIEVIK